MRILTAGDVPDKISGFLVDLGFEVVGSPGDKPEACVCYGGDGTLLGAERAYPGLPKVPLRRNRQDSQYLESLERILRGDRRVTYLMKLDARVEAHHLVALNDVILRNASVTSAVRCQVTIDGVRYFGDIVGDGLVAATPYGSSAYFCAITNSIIHVGIGLAFNNTMESVNHLVVGSDSVIEVLVTRGPAMLAADNSHEQVNLVEGDRIVIRKSGERAEIWEIENLLCMDAFATGESRRIRWLPPVSDNGAPRET